MSTNETPQAKLTGRLAPLLGIPVGLGAFAWLDRVNPPFLATDDGIRDLLLARDCVDLSRCHSIGSPASLDGFYQGALWVDFLTGVGLLGGDTATQRTVVLGLMATAVATLFVVVSRWLRPSMAIPAALLYAATLYKDYFPIQLVSGGGSAFPNLLASAALLAFGLSRRLRFLVVSAIALGIAINEHIVSLTSLPALMAIAIMARPRPWQGLLVSISAVSLTCLLGSSAALRANAAALAEHTSVVWLSVAAGAGTFLCVRLGGSFRNLSWDTRAWVIGAIYLAPFALSAFWLHVGAQHAFAIHYLNPVLAPGAVLLAAIISAPFELAACTARRLRWLTAIPSLIALFLLTQYGLGSPRYHTNQTASEWKLDDAREIATAMTQRGWGIDDLVFRLQGSECRELLVQMTLFAPPPRAPRRDDGKQLKVQRRSDASLGEAVEVELIEVDSWLRSDGILSCRVPAHSNGDATCETARPWTADTDPETFLFSRWSFPEIHSLDLEKPYQATYEIPIQPIAEHSRALALVDRNNHKCGWRITEVRGLEVHGSLPATEITLRSATGKPGTLVVERLFDQEVCSGAPDMRYPPCMLESDPRAALQTPRGSR